VPPATPYHYTTTACTTTEKELGSFLTLYMTLVKYYVQIRSINSFHRSTLSTYPFSPSNLLGTVYPKNFITKAGKPILAGNPRGEVQRSDFGSRSPDFNPRHPYNRPKYTRLFLLHRNRPLNPPRPSLLLTIYRNPGIRLDELPICTLYSLLLLPLSLLIFIRA